jgi:DNA modification methylase
MILTGDCREILPTLDAESVNCCVTSPPYYGLRDYGVEGQIGMEETPTAYVKKLVEVFRDVKRVLQDGGTLWLNLGDSYAGSGKGAWNTHDVQKEVYVPKPCGPQPRCRTPDCKPKDLIGIPWRVAFALQADGWYLRQDIIWFKPNPMPESVTDRCTKSHEYIFLFSKSLKYYFDAESISESCSESSLKRYAQNIENQKGSDRQPGNTNGPMKAVLPRYGGKKYTKNPDVFYRTKSGRAYDPRARRNKRDVWVIPTQPFSGAHFAAYPEELVRNCILAGCPAGGTVLDPFSGSGTTGKVAHELGRQYIGIELNPAYAEASEKRIGAHIQQTLTMSSRKCSTCKHFGPIVCCITPNGDVYHKRGNCLNEEITAASQGYPCWEAKE